MLRKPIYCDLPPIIVPAPLQWLFNGGAAGDLGIRGIDYRDVRSFYWLGDEYDPTNPRHYNPQKARENHRWDLMEQYTDVLWALRRMSKPQQQTIWCLLEPHIWPGDTSRYPDVCGIAAQLMDPLDRPNGWRLANDLSNSDATKLSWIAQAFAVDALNAFLVSWSLREHSKSRYKPRPVYVPEDWRKRIEAMRKPRRVPVHKPQATLRQPKWVSQRFVQRIRKQKLKLKVAS